MQKINIIYNGLAYLPDCFNCLLIMFVKMHSNLAEAYLRNLKFFDIQQKKLSDILYSEVNQCQVCFVYFASFL